jgi:hypothetical protein
MEIYWSAVARLAWDIIRDKALATDWREEEVKDWEQLEEIERIALAEFAKATGRILNGA